MNSLSVTFSDLDRARALSRKLAGNAGQPAPGKKQARYVPFSAAITAAAPLTAERQTARPPFTDSAVVAAPGPEALRDWDSVLGWCLQTTSAKTVFVLDSQGFVIAKAGSWSYDDAEAMGTQLMVALERFDQLDSFNRKAQTITVGFAAFWLSGIRVPPDARDHFTLGILGTQPPQAGVLTSIGEHLADRARQL